MAERWVKIYKNWIKEEETYGEPELRDDEKYRVTFIPLR